ncbi:hypothetical protein D9V86_08005, partial [Bacteroidetes/Chlorobi group bacterium ChocPot_Mid]
IFSSGTPPKPQVVCFYFDPGQCPNAENGVLNIQRAICYPNPGYPDVAGYDNPVSQPVIKVTKRSIRGLEINLGFWTKNVWRTNTYAELYRWKYGDWPSPYEESQITDQQAIDWFNERYTSHTLFGDYPPEQVSVQTKTLCGKTCVQKAQLCLPNYPPYPDNFPAYIGWIEWSDGRKCDIIPIKSYDLKGTVEVHLQPGCPYCWP